MAEMQQLLSALEIQYGGTGVDPGARSEARQFLQRVQEESAFEAGKALVTPPMGTWMFDAAVVFGLSCLDKLVSGKWNELSEAQKAAVRSTAVECALRSTATEAGFIRNKKASLLAQIALREFPQKWPTFVDELVFTKAASDATLEVAFGALAVLAEDCVDADYNGRLPAKRRTDVLKAMNAVAPGFVRELFAFAERAYGLRASQAEDQQMARRRLSCALVCLKHLATWVCWDAEHMKSAVGDPIKFAAYLAANGDLGLEWQAATTDADVVCLALKALRSLAASTHLDFDGALTAASVVPKVCEALYNKGAAETTGPFAADKARLWATLAGCVADVFRDLTSRFKALGISHSDSAATSSDDNKEKPADARSIQVDEAMAAYLATALSVLEASPSSKGAETMLPMWRDVSRLSTASKLATQTRQAAKRFAPRILDRYASHACRRNSKTRDVDFLDEDDYAQHFSAMRAGIATLASSLVDLDALGVAQAVDARLRALLADAQRRDTDSSINKNNNDDDDDDDDFDNDDDDETHRILDGFSLVVERVVEGVVRWYTEERRSRRRSSNSEDSAVLDVLDDGLLGAVLGWVPAPNVATARSVTRLVLFDAVRVVLSVRDRRLGDVLRELFAYLAYDPEPATKGTAEVRRKAAHSLLRLAKAAPRGLTAQFDDLRDGAARVLASNLLCSVGSQYLCEALVLASNACLDADKRRALLEAVVAKPLQDLERKAAAIASPRGLLVALGVLDSQSLEVNFDEITVRQRCAWVRKRPDPSSNAAAERPSPLAGAEEERRALAALLGVARRAAAAFPTELVASRSPCAAPDAPPDLAVLAQRDASAAVLARTLPPVIALARSLHALWAPPIRDALRSHPAARLALAPSPDEIRAKVEPSASSSTWGRPPRSSSSADLYRDAANDHRGSQQQQQLESPKSLGGSFSATDSRPATPTVGGASTSTASSGAPARHSVGAQWASMLNELRSTVYQIARLWIERRCAFAPDAAGITATLLEACGGLVDSSSTSRAAAPSGAFVDNNDTGPEQPSADVVLAATEHRHLALLIKHILEPLALRCPPSLYESHLRPVARRVVDHLERRLVLSWQAEGGGEDSSARLFYQASGLCMPDFDDATVATCADASRRELTRAYLDVLQVAFATRGELTAPAVHAVKNADKLLQEYAESGFFSSPQAPQAFAAATAAAVASASSTGTKGTKDDGDHGQRVAAARDNRSAHIEALRRCFLTGPDVESLAFPILRTLWYAVGKWGDVPSARAATKVAEVCVAFVAADARYWGHLAALFESAVAALVAEPSWLANAGCEYELLALARAVYVSLVIGVDPGAMPRRISPETPLRHDGPRQFLLALPGVAPHHLQTLEAALREPVALKDQKSAVHDVVVLALNAKDSKSWTPSLIDKTTPAIDASALREPTSTVLDLPGEMIGSRKLAAARAGLFQPGPEPPNLADIFRP